MTINKNLQTIKGKCGEDMREIQGVSVQTNQYFSSVSCKVLNRLL